MVPKGSQSKTLPLVDPEDQVNLSRQAQLVPLASLRLDPGNPKAITKLDLDNLRETILSDPDFLWARPICARANGLIYAGHQRRRVVQELWTAASPEWCTAAAAAGIEPGMVPAVVGDVPERLAMERSIRDNNNWGSFDDTKLLLRMREISEMGGDTKLLGFNEEALAKYLPDGSEHEGNGEDAALLGDHAAAAAPICQVGDSWSLGAHTLSVGQGQKNPGQALIEADAVVDYWASLTRKDPVRADGRKWSELSAKRT